MLVPMLMKDFIRIKVVARIGDMILLGADDRGL